MNASKTQKKWFFFFARQEKYKQAQYKTITIIILPKKERKKFMNSMNINQQTKTNEQVIWNGPIDVWKQTKMK